MAASEEQLSPEEKLLRVIQGSDEESAQPGSAPEPEDVEIVEDGPNGAEPPAAEAPVAEPGLIADVPEETVTPAAPEVAAAPPPRLKLAKREPSAAAKAAPAGPSETKSVSGAAPKGDAKKKGKTRVAAAALPKRKAEGADPGVGVVNKCLAVAVVFVLLLTGYEIWANVRGGTLPEQAPVEELPPVPDPSGGYEMPALGTVLAAFDERPMFGQIQEKPKPRPTGGRGAVHIQENVALLGISWVSGEPDVQEAIVVDNVEKKMHFLKTGDKFVAADETFSLSEIHSDRVVFTDGVVEIVLQ